MGFTTSFGLCGCWLCGKPFKDEPCLLRGSAFILVLWALGALCVCWLLVLGLVCGVCGVVSRVVCVVLFCLLCVLWLLLCVMCVFVNYYGGYVMVLSSWNRSALLAFVSYVGLSVVASVVVCVVVSVCSA